MGAKSYSSTYIHTTCAGPGVSTYGHTEVQTYAVSMQLRKLHKQVQAGTSKASNCSTVMPVVRHTHKSDAQFTTGVCVRVFAYIRVLLATLAATLSFLLCEVGSTLHREQAH